MLYKIYFYLNHESNQPQIHKWNDMEQAFLMYEIAFLCWFGEILNEVFSLFLLLCYHRGWWGEYMWTYVFQSSKVINKSLQKLFFVCWIKGWQAEYIAETWFIFNSTTFFLSFVSFLFVKSLKFGWSWVFSSVHSLVLYFSTRSSQLLA